MVGTYLVDKQNVEISQMLSLFVSEISIWCPMISYIVKLCIVVRKVHGFNWCQLTSQFCGNEIRHLVHGLVSDP